MRIGPEGRVREGGLEHGTGCAFRRLGIPSPALLLPVFAHLAWRMYAVCVRYVRFFRIRHTSSTHNRPYASIWNHCHRKSHPIGWLNISTSNSVGYRYFFFSNVERTSLTKDTAPTANDAILASSNSVF